MEEGRGQPEAVGTSGGQVVAEVLGAALAQLRQDNERAYTLLTSEARAGSLEQRQTPARLSGLANRLLRTVEKPEGQE